MSHAVPPPIEPGQCPRCGGLLVGRRYVDQAWTCYGVGCPICGYAYLGPPVTLRPEPKFRGDGLRAKAIHGNCTYKGVSDAEQS